MTKGTFKILSIDGGGIRGVFPAVILQLISERFNININEHFDLITGTSTGSIIAAGLRANITPSEIVNLYIKKGEDIFSQTKKSLYPRKIKPGLHSLYCENNLEKILNEKFGELTLGEISRPLIIPATDIANGGVHVFKSKYSVDFTRDVHIKVKDAVLASCSAPTFFDPTLVGNYLLADGGVWANNPTLIAIVDAQYRLGIPLDNITVLSLGTGNSKVAYGANNNKNWGLLNGWNGQGFIEFLLSLQSQSINNYSTLMLKERLLRLNFDSDRPLPLDDTKCIPDLITRADKLFTYQSREISDLLNLKQEDYDNE